MHDVEVPPSLTASRGVHRSPSGASLARTSSCARISTSKALPGWKGGSSGAREERCGAYNELLWEEVRMGVWRPAPLATSYICAPMTFHLRQHSAPLMPT
jgi:hypothetical protein